MKVQILDVTNTKYTVGAEFNGTVRIDTIPFLGLRHLRPVGSALRMLQCCQAPTVDDKSRLVDSCVGVPLTGGHSPLGPSTSSPVLARLVARAGGGVTRTASSPYTSAATTSCA